MKKLEVKEIINKWQALPLENKIELENNYSYAPRAVNTFGKRKFFIKYGSLFSIDMDGNINGDVDFVEAVLTRIDELIKG